jgi:hypothetical protein
MSTKRTVCMYITGGVVGVLLSQIAIYCNIPVAMRFLSYAVMGFVVGVAFCIKPKQKGE